MFKAILPAAYIAIFAAISVPLRAQTDVQNPVPVVLEEVLVTAQKRTQILQDVPISISVATAQDIADINAFSFTDLVQLTPGVSIFPGIQSAHYIGINPITRGRPWVFLSRLTTKRRGLCGPIRTITNRYRVFDIG
jgi:outer membrane receptor protein involved in Fe transport